MNALQTATKIQRLVIYTEKLKGRLKNDEKLTPEMRCFLESDLRKTNVVLENLRK